MQKQIIAPPPIHWFARFLALLPALLCAGTVTFALWALIFDPKGRIELISLIPIGLFGAGIFGWIAVLGRTGPKPDMNPDAPAPKVPMIVRIWAGVICVLSPTVLWMSLQRRSLPPHGLHDWFNAIAIACMIGYIFAKLARMCLGGYWPESTLRFARRANMTWRQQLAETQREHEHRRHF